MRTPRSLKQQQAPGFESFWRNYLLKQQGAGWTWCPQAMCSPSLLGRLILHGAICPGPRSSRGTATFENVRKAMVPLQK